MLFSSLNTSKSFFHKFKDLEVTFQYVARANNKNYVCLFHIFSILFSLLYSNSIRVLSITLVANKQTKWNANIKIQWEQFTLHIFFFAFARLLLLFFYDSNGRVCIKHVRSMVSEGILFKCIWTSLKNNNYHNENNGWKKTDSHWFICIINDMNIMQTKTAHRSHVEWM